MRALNMLVGGLVGGAIGVAIWTAIVHFTGYEVGFFAWLIGALVGAGVLLGATEAGSRTRAVCAALMAFGAVLAGKACVAYVFTFSSASGFAHQGAITEEYLVSCIADEVVYEYEEQGYELEFPAGEDFEVPDSQDDYPADVWAEAVTRWYDMSDSERAARREQAEAAQSVAGAAAFVLIFLVSLVSPFNLLWMALAMASAYKITRNKGFIRVNQPAAPMTVEEPSPQLGFLPMVAPDNSPDEPIRIPRREAGAEDGSGERLAG